MAAGRAGSAAGTSQNSLPNRPTRLKAVQTRACNGARRGSAGPAWQRRAGGCGVAPALRTLREPCTLTPMSWMPAILQISRIRLLAVMPHPEALGYKISLTCQRGGGVWVCLCEIVGGVGVLYVFLATTGNRATRL